RTLGALPEMKSLEDLIKRIDTGLAAEKAKGEGADPTRVAKLEAQKEALKTVDGGPRELSRFGERPAMDLEAVEKFARQNGLLTPAGKVGGAQTKGWRSGHWSDAFADLVASSDSKSLTPSGRITVPSLSGGIVPINDRALRILDVIPVDPLTGTDQYAF